MLGACPSATFHGMGNSPGPWTFVVCIGGAMLPILLIVIVWMFFRSAVRSGVRQGAPAPMPPPVAPPASPAITEAQIREIVRDEIRRLQAARKGGVPGQASPR